MLEQLRKQLPTRGDARPHANKEEGFRTLRMVAAELLLVTGIGATVDVLTRSTEPQPARIPGGSSTERAPLAAVWGPTLIAPLAAAAHVRMASEPSPNAARASRFLDAAVVALGLAELVASFTRFPSRRRTPSLAPLALASAGMLGLVVSREERVAARERRQLERRAAVLERLVPRRRPKLERVVLHV